MIVSQPYKTQSWNMTHLQLSSWSEGVGALGLVWAHPMVASSFSLSFFFQCIHPSSFSVCFHVTKNSFHSAHVSIELYRLPAFPLALDSGYISTLKLKGGRKRKHYLLIQSCTAVTYFPSAVINSASWNGGWGGGRLFDFVIWSCLLHSFHKAATMWSFLCTVTMAIFLMSSTVHLKEVNWWPERMRWLKRKKKSFIKMLNWVYQDYLG